MLTFQTLATHPSIHPPSRTIIVPRVLPSAIFVATLFVLPLPWSSTDFGHRRRNRLVPGCALPELERRKVGLVLELFQLLCYMCRYVLRKCFFIVIHMVIISEAVRLRWCCQPTATSNTTTATKAVVAREGLCWVGYHTMHTSRYPSNDRVVDWNIKSMVGVVGGYCLADFVPTERLEKKLHFSCITLRCQKNYSCPIFFNTYSQGYVCTLH